jgi:hypothetical protein
MPAWAAQSPFFLLSHQIRLARRGLRARNKKPGRGIPPGRLGAVSVNTLFWKILVTRVKRKVSEFGCGGFVAFVTVLGGENAR